MTLASLIHNGRVKGPQSGGFGRGRRQAGSALADPVTPARPVGTYDCGPEWTEGGMVPRPPTSRPRGRTASTGEQEIWMLHSSHRNWHVSTLTIGVLAALGLAACSDDDDPMDPVDESTSFTLTVRNVSDTSTLPSPLAPGVWALTAGPGALFDNGQRDRGEGLEGLAEDGASAALLGNVAARSTTLASGAIGSAPILPGANLAITFEADPGARLHFGTMFAQSNDLFFSPGEAGISLFNGETPVTGDLTPMLGLWDAGTEINEEPGVGANQAPRQGGPNTGTTEGVVQRVSDGFDYPPTDETIQVRVSSTATANGADFDVTIENLGTSTTPLAPGVWVTHMVSGVLFQNGMPDLSQGLEQLAEDGDHSVLGATLTVQGNVIASDVFGEGPVAPGGSYTFSFSAEMGEKLSFATMFVQSNDLFYAPGADGIDLFPGGVALGSSGEVDVTSMVGLWDAGTEINEEPGVGPNQAPRQSGANVGPKEGIVQPVMDGFTYPATADLIEVTLTVN